MIGRSLLGLTLAIATFAPVSAASAQDTVALSGDVKAVKVIVDATGTRETLVEPTSVIPGDRLVFTTRYSNTSKVQIDNFVITNPLPEAVLLTAEGEFAVSVDGGSTFAALSALRVTAADGTSRPAVLSDVTHIRWTINSIASGASGQVEYFALVR